MQLFCVCCRYLDLQFLEHIMKLYSASTHLYSIIFEKERILLECTLEMCVFIALIVKIRT